MKVQFIYSYEQYINDLKSVSYGREYIKFVNNPKNHISNKEKGENHHIHLRSLGGENGPIVRLSYYNHTKAHLILAKAALQGNFIWAQPALYALNMMSKGRKTKLSELEKITLEDLYDWSLLRKIGHELTGKRNSEIWNSKTPEEKQKQVDNWKQSYHSRTAEQKAETHKKSSYSQKKRFEDPNERAKCNVTKNMTQEEYISFCNNVSAGGYKRYEDPNEREKSRQIQLKRFEDPNERKKLQDYSSNCRWVTNGNEEHFVPLEEIDDYLNNDYRLGRLPFIKLRKNKKGSRWMSNGIDKGIFIKKDIQSKLDNGWFFCNRNGEPLEFSYHILL